MGMPSTAETLQMVSLPTAPLPKLPSQNPLSAFERSWCKMLLERYEFFYSVNKSIKYGLCIAVSIAVLIGLGVGWVFWADSRQPRYQGKSFARWFQIFINPKAPLTNTEAVAAINGMGTNALPYLLRELENDNGSRWARFYWRTYLRANPVLKRWMPAPEMPGIHREGAVYILRQMGSTARPAIPELLRLIEREYLKHYHLQTNGAVDWTELFLHPPVQLFSNSPAFDQGGVFRQEVSQIVMTVGGDNPHIYPMILASAQEREMTGGRSGFFWPYLDSTNLAPSALASEKLLFQASSNANTQIRLISVCGLGLIAGDDPDISHVMLKAIADSDLAIRYQALRGLRAFPVDFRAALAVAWQLGGETNVAITQLAKQLLRSSGGGRPYVTNLKESLSDTNAIVRASAARAMRELPAKLAGMAKERLKELADPATEPDEAVRTEALETLQRIGK